MPDDITNNEFTAENSVLPWSRFVAIGDSFTEGVGDPEPVSPGGLRGWADRFAEVLGELEPDFAYANLAVRGKLIRQVAQEQLAAALDLRPDLISLCAGGNDVIRPGSDPDQVAAQLEEMVSRLRVGGATIVLFTSADVGFSPIFRPIRGKVAIYNENLRGIAQRHDCIVVDLWAVNQLQDSRYWADDRLHYNALGHHTVARAALDALNIPHRLEPHDPQPRSAHTWRRARRGDLVWAREHLVPWVIRRITHVSSGDNVPPKRPEAAVMVPRHGTPES
jgi:lysophospholipase L1-like esterase